MSRIGRKPVPMPANVKVSVADSTIRVEGPKGKLSLNYRSEIDVKVDEAGRQVLVSRGDDERQSRALHGLTRSLIANMVVGSYRLPKKLRSWGRLPCAVKAANTVRCRSASLTRSSGPPGVCRVPDATHFKSSATGKPAVVNSPPSSAMSAPPTLQARASATRRVAAAMRAGVGSNIRHASISAGPRRAGVRSARPPRPRRMEKTFRNNENKCKRPSARQATYASSSS